MSYFSWTFSVLRSSAHKAQIFYWAGHKYRDQLDGGHLCLCGSKCGQIVLIIKVISHSITLEYQTNISTYYKLEYPCVQTFYYCNHNFHYFYFRLKWSSFLTCGPLITSASAEKKWVKFLKALHFQLVLMTN